jgi:predicted glycosyltransferase
MKILIDTGHPVHIHFFYPIAKKLEERNHAVYFTVRNKDCSLALARQYQLNYSNKGKGSRFLLLKPFYLFVAIVKIFSVSRRFKPDLFLSFASPYAGVVSRLFKKPHIVFDDTEPDPLLQFIYRIFSTRIITPACFAKDFGHKHLKIDSYKELSYLHPAHFKPNPEIKKKLTIPSDEEYILIRLVNHGAMHDQCAKKWNTEQKFQFIEQLSKKYHLIISSEMDVPGNLEKYLYRLPASELHQVIAHAKLVIGESATVATEAAVLGVPSVYIDYNSRGYIDEIEKNYELIKRYQPEPVELKKAEGFIHATMQSPPNPKYKEKRQQLLFEKIDITKFMVRFIENYP